MASRHLLRHGAPYRLVVSAIVIVTTLGVAPANGAWANSGGGVAGGTSATPDPGRVPQAVKRTIKATGRALRHSPKLVTVPAKGTWNLAAGVVLRPTGAAIATGYTKAADWRAATAAAKAELRAKSTAALTASKQGAEGRWGLNAYQALQEEKHDVGRGTRRFTKERHVEAATERRVLRAARLEARKNRGSAHLNSMAQALDQLAKTHGGGTTLPQRFIATLIGEAARHERLGHHERAKELREIVYTDVAGLPREGLTGMADSWGTWRAKGRLASATANAVQRKAREATDRELRSLGQAVRQTAMADTFNLTEAKTKWIALEEKLQHEARTPTRQIKRDRAVIQRRMRNELQQAIRRGDTTAIAAYVQAAGAIEQAAQHNAGLQQGIYRTLKAETWRATRQGKDAALAETLARSAEQTNTGRLASWTSAPRLKSAVRGMKLEVAVKEANEALIAQAETTRKIAKEAEALKKAGKQAGPNRQKRWEKRLTAAHERAAIALASMEAEASTRWWIGGTAGTMRSKLLLSLGQQMTAALEAGDINAASGTLSLIANAEHARKTPSGLAKGVRQTVEQHVEALTAAGQYQPAIALMHLAEQIPQKPHAWMPANWPKVPVVSRLHVPVVSPVLTWSLGLPVKLAKFGVNSVVTTPKTRLRDAVERASSAAKQNLDAHWAQLESGGVTSANVTNLRRAAITALVATDDASALGFVPGGTGWFRSWVRLSSPKQVNNLRDAAYRAYFNALVAGVPRSEDTPKAVKKAAEGRLGTALVDRVSEPEVLKSLLLHSRDKATAPASKKFRLDSRLFAELARIAKETNHMELAQELMDHWRQAAPTRP